MDAKDFEIAIKDSFKQNPVAFGNDIYSGTNSVKHPNASRDKCITCDRVPMKGDQCWVCQQPKPLKPAKVLAIAQSVKGDKVSLLTIARLCQAGPKPVGIALRKLGIHGYRSGGRWYKRAELHSVRYSDVQA